MKFERKVRSKDPNYLTSSEYLDLQAGTRTLQDGRVIKLHWQTVQKALETVRTKKYPGRSGVCLWDGPYSEDSMYLKAVTCLGYEWTEV